MVGVADLRTRQHNNTYTHTQTHTHTHTQARARTHIFVRHNKEPVCRSQSCDRLSRGCHAAQHTSTRLAVLRVLGQGAEAVVGVGVVLAASALLLTSVALRVVA